MKALTPSQKAAPSPWQKNPQGRTITFSTKMFKTLAIDLREFPILLKKIKDPYEMLKTKRLVWQETE